MLAAERPLRGVEKSGQQGIFAHGLGTSTCPVESPIAVGLSREPRSMPALVCLKSCNANSLAEADAVPSRYVFATRDFIWRHWISRPPHAKIRPEPARSPLPPPKGVRAAPRYGQKTPLKSEPGAGTPGRLSENRIILFFRHPAINATRKIGSPLRRTVFIPDLRTLCG
jgi:hypothetical protein